MKTQSTLIQAAIVLLALTTSGICADSWDISAGYSATNNPNGAWSYGRKWAVQTNAMDLFTVQWGDSGWYLGNAGNGGPSIQGGPTMWAKNNGNGYPCDRWTCPKLGKYNIEGQFYAADSRGMDSFVYVVINGTITYSNRITSYPQTVAFTNDSMTLNQGDVVDFTTTWGGSVSSEYSWAGVSGAITEIPVVPTLDIRVSQVELCWQTTTNTWYQLQYSSALTTNVWTPLSGWIAGDGTTYCTNDAVPVFQPQKYYRLSVTNSAP